MYECVKIAKQYCYYYYINKYDLPAFQISSAENSFLRVASTIIMEMTSIPCGRV